MAAAMCSAAKVVIPTSIRLRVFKGGFVRRAAANARQPPCVMKKWKVRGAGG